MEEVRDVADKEIKTSRKIILNTSITFRNLYLKSPEMVCLNSLVANLTESLENVGIVVGELLLSRGLSAHELLVVVHDGHGVLGDHVVTELQSGEEELFVTYAAPVPSLGGELKLLEVVVLSVVAGEEVCPHLVRVNVLSTDGT